MDQSEIESQIKYLNGMVKIQSARIDTLDREVKYMNEHHKFDKKMLDTLNESFILCAKALEDCEKRGNENTDQITKLGDVLEKTILVNESLSKMLTDKLSGNNNSAMEVVK